jgi:hypothetical protein
MYERLVGPLPDYREPAQWARWRRWLRSRCHLAVRRAGARLLTALALYEQSAGKSFAGADLRFVAGGWVLLLLPWLLRMGRH